MLIIVSGCIVVLNIPKLHCCSSFLESFFPEHFLKMLSSFYFIKPHCLSTLVFFLAHQQKTILHPLISIFFFKHFRKYLISHTQVIVPPLGCCCCCFFLFTLVGLLQNRTILFISIIIHFFSAYQKKEFKNSNKLANSLLQQKYTHNNHHNQPREKKKQIKSWCSHASSFFSRSFRLTSFSGLSNRETKYKT